MNSITLPSPAKLNLFLHITGRRPDGYHNLQTVFQLVDYADELTCCLRDNGALTLTPGIDGVDHDDNLIIRAAKALQKKCAIERGADIRLLKKLPMGGGLGGGSSNAATTLLALNTLWNCGLSLDELAEIGLTLGADVPVFIRGFSAWAEGIGEQLTPVSLGERHYVVLIPNAHVDTAAAFQHPDLTRDTSPITLRAFLAGAGRNDFQTVVADLAPSVSEALAWLANFGEAKLTGTGCCVFLTCSQKQVADDILRAAPFSGFTCKGTDQSTAHQALAEWSRKHRI